MTDKKYVIRTKEEHTPSREEKYEGLFGEKIVSQLLQIVKQDIYK